jgi:hypothetical protein
MRDFKLPSGEIMLGRIRYFSDGMVIGSGEIIGVKMKGPGNLFPILLTNEKKNIILKPSIKPGLKFFVL